MKAPRWPIWLLLVLALVAELLPLPAAVQPLRPAWTTMLVIYWSLMWPGRFGVFSAFVAGLLVDVAHGSFNRESEILGFLAENFGPYPFKSSGGIVDDIEGVARAR